MNVKANDNLTILKNKISQSDLHGIFIAPILNNQEKDALRAEFDKPFIFAQIPICGAKSKRTVELELYSGLDSLWLPALEKKSDFRVYKNLATMSYEHFIKYITVTFGSYGLIIIMRNHPVGFNGVQRKEKIDELEYSSVKLTRKTESEIGALELLWKMKPGINDVISKEPSQKINVKNTDWSYDNNAIYYDNKIMFKSNTAKYVIMVKLFENYNDDHASANRESLVALLKDKGHFYNPDTIRTLISKIRNNIDGFGEILCKKAGNKHDKPGYYFIP